MNMRGFKLGVQIAWEDFAALACCMLCVTDHADKNQNDGLFD
jgi:hypothetical protein